MYGVIRPIDPIRINIDYMNDNRLSMHLVLKCILWFRIIAIMVFLSFGSFVKLNGVDVRPNFTYTLICMHNLLFIVARGIESACA